MFLTVCTEKRESWLANASIQRNLHHIWKSTATAWLVSYYLLMPDHLHLFCAPRDMRFTIERWIGFWKDRLAKANSEAGIFQSGGFHHRLRDGESYAQKWQYVQENPVRQNLVKEPEEWPYRDGCMKFIGDANNFGWRRNAALPQGIVKLGEAKLLLCPNFRSRRRRPAMNKNSSRPWRLCG